MLIAHGPHVYSTLSSTCLAILLLEACTYPFSIVCLTLAPTVFTYHIAGNIGGLQTLRFGPKLTVKKILAEFKFGSGISGLFNKPEGALPSLT